MLKCLQPHRERPSKDRSKRFAAADLPCDKKSHEEHDVCEMDYWLVNSPVLLVREAKWFLLGQVLYMSILDKVCHSACSTNPSLMVTFMIHEYDPDTHTHTRLRAALAFSRQLLYSGLMLLNTFAYMTTRV